MHFQNDMYPTQPFQLEGLREPGPKGPIVMVNLLKFKDKAVYEDGRATDLSGHGAYLLYGIAVAGLVMGVGGRIIYSGDVSFLTLGQAEPLWDQISLAEYPNRAALVRMASSPEYAEISVHRTAGLAGQLNIETVPKFNLADAMAKANK
jgi:uncharacterized protein (DUF1330 family)